MTKPSNHIEKQMDPVPEPKPTKRDRSWQLMIVGDHGTIFSFRRIKGLAFTILFFFAMALLTAAAFGYLYFTVQKETVALERQIQIARDQIADLRQEKDVLQASLVIAKTKLGEEILPSSSVTTGQDTPVVPPTKAPLEETPGELPPADVPDASAPPSESEVDQEKMAAPQAPAPIPPAVPEEPAAEATAPPQRAVVVENLKVAYDASRDLLTAQFKIKNAAPKAGRVAGRCILVLENKIEGQKQWLSLPAVNLIAGKPSGKRGRAFRISRFMNIRLKSMDLPDAFSIEHGTLYVFSSDGEILLEEDVFVSLAHEKKAPPPAQPPQLPQSEADAVKAETAGVAKPSAITSKGAVMTNSNPSPSAGMPGPGNTEPALQPVSQKQSQQLDPAPEATAAEAVEPSPRTGEAVESAPGDQPTSPAAVTPQPALEGPLAAPAMPTVPDESLTPSDPPQGEAPAEEENGFGEIHR